MRTSILFVVPDREHGNVFSTIGKNYSLKEECFARPESRCETNYRNIHKI